jgi:hypothetical protein
MSALLRRSAMIAAAGRPLDRNARLDIAAMRAAANALLAAIDDIGVEPMKVADRLRQAACELHRIAVRQLDAKPTGRFWRNWTGSSNCWRRRRSRRPSGIW